MHVAAESTSLQETEIVLLDNQESAIRRSLHDKNDHEEYFRYGDE